jgi:hypothetical protein
MNKDIRLGDITPLDVQPYQSSGTAVRLFIDGKWFAGILDHFSINQDPYLLRFELYGHLRQDPPTPANEPGESLFSDRDKLVGEITVGGQAFVIVGPKKVIRPNDPSDVLVIKFKNGIAIMSHRQEDMAKAKRLLQMAEALHQ